MQINKRTGRSRPVRRKLVTGSTEWQWWDEETTQWHTYEAPVSAQIESAWTQCYSSNAYYQHDSPAGIIVRIHHSMYTIQFEADAVQTNLISHYPRKVRRRLAPSNAPGGTALSVNPPTSVASGSQQTDSVPTPSIAVGAVSLAYNPEDLVAYVETSGDVDCPICVGSLCEKNAVRLSKCSHTYCKECITKWFQNKPTCPLCTKAYGLITGMQPSGTMSIRFIPSGSNEAASGLEGFPGIDIIQIRYNMPNGIQVLFLTYFMNLSHNFESELWFFISFLYFRQKLACPFVFCTGVHHSVRQRCVPVRSSEILSSNSLQSIQTQGGATQVQGGLRTCPKTMKVKKFFVF